MAKCSPLHKATDATRWDAEDIFGRLCIFTHAAFLYAGFHPRSVPAATPWSLSRRYSVLSPQAAHHQDAAVTIVLRLYRQWGQRRRGRAHMALRVYVMANGGGRYMSRREWFGRAALETVLSGSVDDTARALRVPGSAGECLWKLLSDEICRGLFLYACEANGVPVMPDFASLPGDIKMAILEKLDDGKDVAMAECASKELRDLVAGHDSLLWKAKYEAVIISSFSYMCRMFLILVDKGKPLLIRWKERYAMARNSMSRLLKPQQSELNPMHHISHIRPWAIQETMKLLGTIPKPRRNIRKVIHEPRKLSANIISVVAHRKAIVEENRIRRIAGRTMTMVPKRSHGKEHQAGSIHSPSSRYHWKHR
ncbi:unnamed protein product [Urochloa decumbens]|uniref:F-box domain-containing protein n=1 Tax=Urochloa decumbens TaxID=240449 RepID=A0ABC8XXU3_9POAL